MQQIFSVLFMKDNCGCYKEENYSRLMSCSFMQHDEITLDSILNSDIPLKDKYWFVCKKLATKEQNQQIAIGVAEIVLSIYESMYPYNKSPQESIRAAKYYLYGIIGIDELRKKRAAADVAAAAATSAAIAAYAAAYAAVDAAVDAYAAVDAAIAAYAAASAAAATDAAVAAATAAYAAASAAAATDAAVDGKPDYKQQLLDFLINFCK